MTPEELKESIIRNAMQGKLTVQNESDSDVYEWLAEVKKIKNTKRDKKLLPITDDDIPFDIPANWCWVRFADIVDYNMGKTPPRDDMECWGDDLPWVSIADMPNNGHISQTKEGVTKHSLSTVFSDRISKAGTMIMSFKLTVGRVSILDVDAVHNEAIISIYPYLDDERIVQQYLFILLPVITQYGDSKNAIKGKTLNDTSISNLLIPLPPKEEQKRIVAKIEELLPLVDKYAAAYNRLEELNKTFPGDLKKSILQYAIQGKLVEQRPEEGTADDLYAQIQNEKQRLIKEGKIKKEKPLPEITDDEIPFDIPESWKWVSINEIAFVTKLAGFEYTDYISKSICDNGEVPLVRAKNIKPNCFIDNIQEFISLELSEKLSRCALDKKCVLMTFIGAGIGEVAIFDKAKRYHLAPNVAKIVPHIDLCEYLLLYLMSASGQKQVFQYMKQTAQPSLSMETIRKVYVPLPPLEEQKRIVELATQLLLGCETNYFNIS